MAILQVTYPDLKAGDIVPNFYGGTFEITGDARDVSNGTPETVEGAGPVHVAYGTCLEDFVKGYFYPGSQWTFQGNRLAVITVDRKQA